MSVIGVLDIFLRGDSSQLNKAFGKATSDSKKASKEIKQSFDTNLFDRFSAAGSSAFSSLITKVGTTVAGVLALRSVISNLHQSMERITALYHQSTKLGISTSDLVAIQMAFDDVGEDVAAASTGILKLRKNISEAATSGGEAKKTFDELGLSAKDLNGKSASDQFKIVIDALQAIPNETDRVRLSMDLLGKGGASFLNVFKNGSADLSAAVDKSKELGQAISDFDAAQVANTKQAMDDLGTAVEGVYNRLVVNLAPALEQIATALTPTTDSVNGLYSGVSTLNYGFELLTDFVKWTISDFHSFEAEVADFVRLFAKMGSVLPSSLGGDFFTVLAEEEEKVMRAKMKLAEDVYKPIEHKAPQKKQTTLTPIKDNSEELKKQADAQQKLIDKFKDTNPLTKLLGEQKEYGQLLKDGKITQQDYTAWLTKQAHQLVGLDDPITSVIDKLKQITSAQKAGLPVGDAYNQTLKISAQDLLGFDADPIETLKQKWEQLQRGVRSGLFTFDDAKKSYDNFKHSLFDFPDTPEKKIAKLMEELQKLQSVLSPEQYKLALADRLQQLGVVKLPIDNTKEYVNQLHVMNLALKNGLISYDQYLATARQLQNTHFGIDPTVQQQMQDFANKAKEISKLSAGQGLTQDQVLQAKIKQLPDYLKSAWQDTQTPLEQYGEKLQELSKWEKYLPKNVYDKLKQSLYKNSGLAQPIQFASAMDYGGQQARSVMLQYKYQPNQNDIEKQALAEAKKSNELLKQIAEKDSTRPATF